MNTRFEHAYVLNVVSTDHPGIVAAVCAAVKRFGGNMDACSQTVVRGYFTLIMVVSYPEKVDPDALADVVRESGSGGYMVTAFEANIAVEEPHADVPNRFVLTAFGKDQQDIILRFSGYLAGKDINIVDLYGERQGDDFVLISQVEVPSRYDIAMLQAELESLPDLEGVHVRLQHENIFVATNQLRMNV